MEHVRRQIDNYTGRLTAFVIHRSRVEGLWYLSGELIHCKNADISYMSFYFP